MAIDYWVEEPKKQECNGVKSPTKTWLKRMTPQEALELLNNIEFKHEHQGQDQYADMLMWCKDALEKQIPKKVILVEEECNCPNCLFDMMGVYDFSNADTTDPKFCPECGQALDWGD